MADEPRTQDSGLFALGVLHGKVETLTARVDKQESILAGMDKKLDDVLLNLASAVGGRDRTRMMIKVLLSIVTAFGAISGTIFTLLHIGVKP